MDNDFAINDKPLSLTDLDNSNSSHTIEGKEEYERLDLPAFMRSDPDSSDDSSSLVCDDFEPFTEYEHVSDSDDTTLDFSDDDEEDWSLDECPEDCNCRGKCYEPPKEGRVAKLIRFFNRCNLTGRYSPDDDTIPTEHTATNDAAHVSKSDVMAFVDDVAITANTHSHKSKDVESDFDELVDPSIEIVLARPQYMTTYTWGESTANNSFPIMEFPDFFLKHSSVARNKLSDYKYLRNDFKFRFTVNTSKFASGRIYFFVIHLRKLSGSRNSRESSTKDYTMATAYRGVELDLGSSDTCELEVPFIAPHSAVDLTAFDYPLFELRAMPLTDIHIDGKSSSKMNINVYASMHNINLAIPTTRPFAGRYMPDDSSYVTDRISNLGRMTLKNNLYGVIAGTEFTPIGQQSGTHQNFLFTTARGIERQISIPLHDIPSIFNYPHTLDLTGQGPLSVRVTEHTGVEAEEASTGVVSGALHKISAASGKLSTIPMIGEYASTVSWVSELLGGAAKIFGFAKPTSVAALTPTALIPAKNFTNYDGVDNSVVMGTSMETSISGHDRFGCAEDEMSIPYVVSRSQMVDVFSWTPDHGFGATIATFPVNPMYCDRDIMDENNTGNALPTLIGHRNHVTIAGYTAAIFKWWRGSMRYRLSLSKTAFHSGRLRITWHPHRDDPITKFESSASHTRIYDIRESNEIEFEVPFHANRPFRRVRFKDGTSHEGANGFISIQAENVLVCPEQVKQSVDILMFQSMSPEDTAFHTPTFNLAYPMNMASTSWHGAQSASVAEQTETIEEHTGIFGGGLAQQQRSEHVTHSKDVLAPTKKSPIYKAGLLAGGECVRSLRALSRRFGLATVFQCANGASSFKLDTASYDITPLSYSPSSLDSTNGDADEVIKAHKARYACAVVSPLGYISRLYRMYVGGRRYKVDTGTMPASTTTTSATFIALRGATGDPGDDSHTNFVDGSPEGLWHRGAGTFRHATSNHTNQFHEIEIPYQQSTSVAPIVNGTLLHAVERPVARFHINAHSQEYRDVPIYEAAADDHSFGLLVSPPFLYDKGEPVLRHTFNDTWYGPQSQFNGFSLDDIVGKTFTYLSFDWTVSSVDSHVGEITAYRNEAGQMISETFSIWSIIDAKRNGQLASTQLTLDALLSAW